MLFERFAMEDTELEEGEANYKDDMSFDPDISLSYIGEKLQSVLGHIQKDFEGEFSAENLGAKYGGYGSFLPTHQRSPSVLSQPKPAQHVQIPSSSWPNALPTEIVPQSSAAPSDVGRALRLGTASRSSQPVQPAKVPSADVLAKQDSSLSLAPVTEKLPLKQEPVPNKPPNSSERRTLKVRIKVGSDKTLRKNVAIYSGLGLISPSSSTGNSVGESGGVPSNCQVSIDDSPNHILQVMTSFPVPGDFMLSPLHENLLCIVKKDRLLESTKSVSSIKSVQENSILPADNFAPLPVHKKVPKEKKIKAEKNDNCLVALKPEIGVDCADSRRTVAKREDTIEAKSMVKEKAFLSNDMKVKPVSNSACNALDSVEASVPVSGVLRVTKKNTSEKRRQVVQNGMGVRLSTGSVKEENWESSSDREDSWLEKIGTKIHSQEKKHESTLGSSFMTGSNDQREDDPSKDSKLYAPSKAITNGSKCKINFSGRPLDHPRDEVFQTDIYQEPNEIKVPRGEGKSSFDGKRKSKSSRSNGKPASEADQISMAIVAKDKKQPGKMHSSMSRKDAVKVRHNYKDLLEEKDYQLELLDRPSNVKGMDINRMAVEKDRHAFLEKSKPTSSGRRVDTQLSSKAIIEDTANEGFPPKTLVHSEMELPSVAPVLIEEDWVACDRCGKWRLLPYGSTEKLPEKWLCSMLNWLPGMNRCEISEEETTKALHALYQLPLPESQSNLQSDVGKTSAGALSVGTSHFDKNHSVVGSDGVLHPRKKKERSNEKPYGAASGVPLKVVGSTKSSRREIVKAESVYEMNQPILKSSSTRHSNGQKLSKSEIFGEDLKALKHEEKHTESGDSKRKRLKKRGADQNAYGSTTKKIKADFASVTNDLQASDGSGRTGMIARVSASCLSTKAVVKSTAEQDGQFYSKDINSGRMENVHTSVMKQVKCASVSPHTVSLGMKRYDEREMSLKKRTVKDWQASQNYVESSDNHENYFNQSRVPVEEKSTDYEVRKAKKCKLSSTDGKEFITNKGGDSLNRKDKASKILLSSGRESPGHGMDEYRSRQNDRQTRLKAEVASKSAFDGIDPLKRDAGVEHFSRAAASSSSKISDSQRSRTNNVEVRGSPVESVSSSPMRMYKVGNLSPGARDTLAKDSNDDYPGIDRSIRSADGLGKVSGSRRKVSTSLLEPELDLREKGAMKQSAGKPKLSARPLKVQNTLVNREANDPEAPCRGNSFTSDHQSNEERTDKNSCHGNDLFSQKSRTDSHPLSKDKDRIFGNSLERIKVKLSFPPKNKEVLDPKLSRRDEGTCHIASEQENPGSSRHRIKPVKGQKSVGIEGCTKSDSDYGKENQLGLAEHDSSAMKLVARSSKVSRFAEVSPQQKCVNDFEAEVAERSDPTQVESRGLNSQVCTRAGELDTPAHASHLVPSRNKNSVYVVAHASSGNVDTSHVLNQSANAVNNLNDPASDRHASKDTPKRGTSSHAASIALKEAERLRDYADRLKDSGFGFECNEAYFQAALKFLHGASLLETCSSDKYGDTSQMQIYRSAADLCEICAREYEQRQEMAAAALAYKCMEVAFMKVVYCKNSTTNRDRHDLQASLQVAPQGESPSSSASDVDNLNQATGEKVALPKGVGAHSGNHVIIARNRTNFVRLLDFTKDVHSAMEASRKSQNAFAAANVILEQAHNKEGITSVKRVIDFSFQDVEELVRLVQHAIEAISRQRFGGS